MKRRIAAVIGYFRPLSLEYYQIIKNLQKKYQIVYVFIVSNLKLKLESGIGEKIKKKTGNPFLANLGVILVQKSFPESNIKVLKINNFFIKDILDAIYKDNSKNRLSKIDIYISPDEYKNFINQKKYLSSNSDYELKEINLHNRESVFASKILEALKKSNYILYKQLIAPPLANLEDFNHLRKYYDKVISEEKYCAAGEGDDEQNDAEWICDTGTNWAKINHKRKSKKKIKTRK